ncbi:MAG: tyrosine-type recombinase/integrase [Clostridia bacterium]
MDKWKSKFQNDIISMLDYYEALGYKRFSHEKTLLKFDNYCADNFPKSSKLSEKIVISWLESENTNLSQKAGSIRIFGKYLVALGKDAYVLYEKYSTSKIKSKPYIFTDEELKHLFHSIDKMKATKTEPFIHEILPVIFRLIYTCGLRPNEGRQLKTENVNLKTGEIFITNTKGKKDRIVVTSDDMRRLLKFYMARREIFGGDNDYLFPSFSNEIFTSNQINNYFKKAFSNAFPDISKEELPSIRTYDLRHRFASAVLNRWLDNKENLASKLPYLRAYMGHKSLSETSYYIHLLPENLLKSTGIDWQAFEGIIPEVSLWEE